MGLFDWVFVFSGENLPMKKPNLVKVGKMVAGDKAPKPSVSLAKIGKQTQAIHDELHGRKPKK